jgi:hypothetical protein
MASFSGPEIANDGLIFHMDMENTKKSFRGKPTTNYAYQNGFTQTTTGRTFPTSSEIPEIKQLKSLVGKIRNMTRMQNSTTSWIDLFSVSNIPLPAGSYLYISCYVFIPDNKPTNRFNANGNFGADLGTNATLGAYGVSTQNVETGVWTRLVWRKQNTTASQITVNTVRMEPYRPIDWTDDAIDMYYCNPQFEVGDIATPFIRGVRSNTMAIKDMSGLNNTITPANLTYNSDNTFEFDGINDFLTTFKNNEYFVENQNWTISSFVNVVSSTTSGNGRGGIFCNQRYTSEANPGGFGLAIYNGDFCGMLTHDDGAGTKSAYHAQARIDINYNTIEMITYVYNHSVNTIYAYRNGELVTSVTNASFKWSPGGQLNSKIGTNTQGGWTYYFNMKIYELKVYDRALTAKEIKNNFEAGRSRFDI